MTYRLEHDSLGEVKVPQDVYYGAQTKRALDNFPVSGEKNHPLLIKAYVILKKACALTNAELGVLDKKRSKAIIHGCDELISDRYTEQIVIDKYQAGAGTSLNMNINEVIANIALERLGYKKGDYDYLSPNDHVNMSQSTNDTFPTASHIALIWDTQELIGSLVLLVKSLHKKAAAFKHLLKSGRTHLQAAVPVTLGQEFFAYEETIKKSISMLRHISEPVNPSKYPFPSLLEVAIGGTAVGTGLNTPKYYRDTVIKNLNKATGLNLIKSADPREALQSRIAISRMSSTIHDIALELIRIANDLRLLSSGTITGIGEINLPAVQPGSSIMPGKANPVMAEALNMICFRVIGNALTVSMAEQAGQLELNVMMPVMINTLLESIDILKNFIPVFARKAVDGITVNKDRLDYYFKNTPSIATILNPIIGYLKAAEVVKQSISEKRPVTDIIIEKGLMGKKELDGLLKRDRITGILDNERNKHVGN